jgi:competence protein ComEA
MTDRAEQLLTVLLASACLGVALMATLPRMTVRQVPIAFEEPDITVSVAGEVERPGVYRLPFRSRVADALELAGGMTATAEASLLELAATLTTGDSVHVPAKIDGQGAERISLNSAAARELELLPGVGPVTAARIVEGRPYGRLEDLLRVRGIGEKTLERLRAHVRL